MRKVAFVYLHCSTDCDGMNEWSFSRMINNDQWVEVEDDVYWKLRRYFHDLKHDYNDVARLIMVEFDDSLGPRVIEDVLKLADEYEAKILKEKQKAAERKAARLKAKTEKDIEEKKKLLEKLKKELGED